MIKLIAYRLTLFVLLFCSFTQLFANLYYLADAESAYARFVPENQGFTFVWFSKERQEDRLSVLLFENEEKEDDEFQFKKHFDLASYSILVSFAPTFGHLFNFDKNTFPFHRDLSYTSNCRYLSLQVFRIWAILIRAAELSYPPVNLVYRLTFVLIYLVKWRALWFKNSVN